MRVTDHRYSRDTARLDLAVRLIRLEARTHTIRHWTGLTDDRIRKLYRSYLRDCGEVVKRHRGKSPRQASYFLRSGRTARHASVFAAVLTAFGALPIATRGSGARRVSDGAAADLLCEAYEAYCGFMPEREISFEHAVYLASALSQGGELRLRNCAHCTAQLVSDAVALRTPVCERCQRQRRGIAAPRRSLASARRTIASDAHQPSGTDIVGEPNRASAEGAPPTP
jgi:hypothetical protein